MIRLDDVDGACRGGRSSSFLLLLSEELANARARLGAVASNGSLATSRWWQVQSRSTTLAAASPRTTSIHRCTVAYEKVGRSERSDCTALHCTAQHSTSTPDCALMPACAPVHFASGTANTKQCLRLVCLGLSNMCQCDGCLPVIFSHIHENLKSFESLRAQDACC